MRRANANDDKSITVQRDGQNTHADAARRSNKQKRQAGGRHQAGKTLLNARLMQSELTRKQDKSRRSETAA